MIDSVTVVSREELRTAIENGYPLIYAHNGAKRWIKRRFAMRIVHIDYGKLLSQRLFSAT